MEKCFSWTNTRAMTEKANIGDKYVNFTIFTLNELMKHTGLYLFQALSTSPQIEIIFYSSQEDPVSCNNFIYNALGRKTGNSTRSHRHFKLILYWLTQPFPPHQEIFTQIGRGTLS